MESKTTSLFRQLFVYNGSNYVCIKKQLPEEAATKVLHVVPPNQLKLIPKSQIHISTVHLSRMSLNGEW